MFNVVLVHPQIPPNTGNIGRLCVNTASRLHLIEPLGFSIDEKAVRRAGLDYWHKVDLVVWNSLEEFLATVDPAKMHLATTKSHRPYFQTQYRPGDYLLFGSETAGLPYELLDSFSDRAVTIPMAKEGRSLNLAVSVGIILYEAIRQNYSDFSMMCKE